MSRESTTWPHGSGHLTEKKKDQKFDRGREIESIREIIQREDDYYSIILCRANSWPFSFWDRSLELCIFFCSVCVARNRLLLLVAAAREGRRVGCLPLERRDKNGGGKSSSLV